MSARRLLSAVALLCALALLPAGAAQADTRARNGLIAYSKETNRCAGPAGECDSYVWTVRPNGRGKRRLPCSTSVGGCRDVLPVFAPGGRRLVTTTNGASDYTGDLRSGEVIAVRRAGGAVVRRISLAERVLNALAWSPDATRLGFTLPKAIYTVKSDGSDEALYRDVAGGDLAWSSQGRLAWVTEPFGGRGRVNVTNEARTKARKLRIRASSIAWSPTGQRLAYATKNELWTMLPNGRKRRKITRRCTGPQDGSNYDSDVAWSPDGRQLLCSTVRGKLLAVDAKTGRVRVVVRGTVNPITSFDWQRTPRR